MRTHDVIAGEDDLPAALTLYHECFPQGRFPDAVRRSWKKARDVYLLHYCLAWATRA